jgi:hypothetical protein
MRLYIIINLYIFPLISPRYSFSIDGLTIIMKIVGRCDVKYIMTDKKQYLQFQSFNLM